MDTLKYPTPQALMEDTCNAIREKDGTSEKIDHQDVPDRIRAIATGPDVDLSGITAQRGDVSERVQFIDSSGKLDYGTMPEIADETVTLDGNNTEHDIEEGHHTGGGKVQIVPDTLSLTPSFKTQEITSPDGIVYTKVILDPIPDIYTDVSGADATPAQVLKGSKFVGAAGSVEEGGVEIRSGKRFTVTTNGLKSISSAYYDSSAYFEVNVPQNIVSGGGEDSTDCNATSSDVRIYNDSGQPVSFRAGGNLRYGGMRDVELPEIMIYGRKQVVEGKKNYLVYATSEVVAPGYLAEGKTSYKSGPIEMYCSFNGDKIKITPGKEVQQLATAGKYLEENIEVEAVKSGGGFHWVEYNADGVKSEYIQIPKSKLEGEPFEIHINRTSTDAASFAAYVVESLYILFEGNTVYNVSAVVVKGGTDGNAAFMYKESGYGVSTYFTLKNSNTDGITITANTDDVNNIFIGNYNIVVISEA